MKFKVGDVCVVLPHANHGTDCKNRVGMECEIDCVNPGSVWDYGIIFPDGKAAFCIESVLKLKNPPDYLRKVSWDSCIWKPKGVTV